MDVVHRHFENHEAPSTLLGVAVLGYPDQLVEVEAVAVLPWSLAVRLFNRRTLPAIVRCGPIRS